MKGNFDLFYNPHDKTARTMNKRSNWEMGLLCMADVPEKGQIVYVNRPQNNAYAEECKVEILPSHAKRKNNVLFKAIAHDGWAHFCSVYDVGNDVFFSFSEAQNALVKVLKAQITINLNGDSLTDNDVCLACGNKINEAESDTD
jgi:hypothetical protein